VKAVLRIVLIALLLGAVAFGGYKGYQRYLERQAAEAGAHEPTRALRVSYRPVISGDVAREEILTGTVRAMAVVDVTPEVSGRLDCLCLEDGTPVDKGLVIEKAGARIGIINHERLSAEVRQAKAALSVAQAAEAEAKVVLNDADREKNRISDLFKKGSVTERQRDQAVTAFERARAAHLLAQAKVDQARAALDRAQTVLDEAFVRAPIAGVVARRYLDEGNMVSPSTPIVRIVQIDTVEVVVGVNERHVGLVREGQTRATVEVDTNGRRPYEGTVANVGVTSDPTTHTVEVEIHVPNPKHELRPGAFARVRLVLERRTGVPLVPATAILREGEAAYVFLVRAGRAERRPIEPGRAQRAHVEVRKGLEVGDRVVVRGQHLLQDGARVEVVTKEGAS
jgi:RND family efflux transporter MFP subunit